MIVAVPEAAFYSHVCLAFALAVCNTQVTLPCRPRDWHVVDIPSPVTKADTESGTRKIKTTVKQPTAVRQACSTPTSSPFKSSYEAKGTDSSATSQPRSDAAAMGTTAVSVTEPQEASIGLSSATIISGPSPSLLADVPLSPATSSPLSALEQSNSSTLSEDSLATITAEDDFMWATSTWTYQDAFKVRTQRSCKSLTHTACVRRLQMHVLFMGYVEHQQISPRASCSTAMKCALAVCLAMARLQYLSFSIRSYATHHTMSPVLTKLCCCSCCRTLKCQSPVHHALQGRASPPSPPHTLQTLVLAPSLTSALPATTRYVRRLSTAPTYTRAPTAASMNLHR